MRKPVIALLSALLALTPAGSAAPQARAAPACDRACLESLMNRYLASLLAHDPSALPLAAGAKFTENTNAMALGDGFWQTIDSVSPKARIYVSDPQTGQIGFYGAATENGNGVLLAVRLKEVNLRLTEIESFVVRPAPGIHGAFDNMPEPEPIWSQPLAPSERTSRAAMVHAADQYFEGILQGSGDIIPFEGDCTRWENGIQTAPAKATPDRPAMNMHDTFNAVKYSYIHDVTDRRYGLVDEEHGLVFGTAMLQHPGNVKMPGMEDVTKTPGNLLVYPNTTQILPLFKIRGGKIASIYSYVMLQSYRQKPGW